MGISKRIAEAREAAGLTQKQLADAVRVSQPTVAGWESGAHAPLRAKMSRVAEVLKRSVQWLEHGGIDPNGQTGGVSEPAGGYLSPSPDRSLLDEVREIDREITALEGRLVDLRRRLGRVAA